MFRIFLENRNGPVLNFVSRATRDSMWQSACSPVEVTGKDSCEGIRFKKCLSVKDEEGRFAPVFDENTTEDAECTTVLFSAKTGEGVDEWCDWLKKQVSEWNEK
ncbi:MAG: hypothetical protein ACI4W2_06645 [Eubacterium sp.]